jgi:hypothetical protein
VWLGTERGQTLLLRDDHGMLAGKLRGLIANQAFQRGEPPLQVPGWASARAGPAGLAR